MSDAENKVAVAGLENCASLRGEYRKCPANILMSKCIKGIINSDMSEDAKLTYIALLGAHAVEEETWGWLAPDRQTAEAAEDKTPFFNVASARELRGHGLVDFRLYEQTHSSRAELKWACVYIIDYPTKPAYVIC